MTVHFIKTTSRIFSDMKEGKKTFDYRKNDRDYKVGDCLNLVDFNPETGASGLSIDFEVTYILYGGEYGIPKDYCIMQLKRLKGMYYG